MVWPHRYLNGKEELSYMDSVPDVVAGDYVLVAYGCITERLDPAVAEQAIAAMAGLVSDEPFVLKSAQGDDAYQPGAGSSGAPVPDPASWEVQQHRRLKPFSPSGNVSRSLKPPVFRAKQGSFSCLFLSFRVQ